MERGRARLLTATSWTASAGHALPLPPRRPATSFPTRRRAGSPTACTARRRSSTRPRSPWTDAAGRGAAAARARALRAARRHVHAPRARSTRSIDAPRRPRRARRHGHRAHAGRPVPRRAQLGLRRRRSSARRSRPTAGPTACGGSSTPATRAASPSSSTSSTTTSGRRATTSSGSARTSPTATARRGAQAVNFDGPGSDEVRRFFVRQRAALARRVPRRRACGSTRSTRIVDTSAAPFLARAVATVVAQLGERRRRRLTLIAESDLNDPRVIRPARRAASGSTRSGATTSTTPLHARCSPASATATTPTSATLGDLAKRATARASSTTGATLAVPRPPPRRAAARASPGASFVVFAQNHDQVGNRALGERLPALVRLRDGQARRRRSCCSRRSCRCCSWARSTARRRRSRTSPSHADAGARRGRARGRAARVRGVRARRRACPTRRTDDDVRALAPRLEPARAGPARAAARPVPRAAATAPRRSPPLTRLSLRDADVTLVEDAADDPARGAARATTRCSRRSTSATATVRLCGCPQGLARRCCDSADDAFRRPRRGADRQRRAGPRTSVVRPPRKEPCLMRVWPGVPYPLGRDLGRRGGELLDLLRARDRASSSACSTRPRTATAVAPHPPDRAHRPDLARATCRTCARASSTATACTGRGRRARDTASTRHKLAARPVREGRSRGKIRWDDTVFGYTVGHPDGDLVARRPRQRRRACRSASSSTRRSRGATTGRRACRGTGR